MNNKIREIFIEAKSQLLFKRISATHPLDLYLGYNESRNKTLALIIEDVDINFQSTKLIEVTINLRHDNKKSLCFSLLDDTESDIFYKFCEDIIESTLTSTVDNALKIINNRWNSWINVFKNPHSLLLSEKEIRGLIGELIFLKDYMMKKYTISEAIESYVGPLSSHKDFEINETWYEIKTCYQSSKSITISSIEQLDSNISGHLCIVELENSNKYVSNHITLNEIIKNIIDLINDPVLSNAFKKKLSEMGYYYCEEYNNNIYYCSGINYYLVDNKFPRLKKDNLPKEISTVSYELLIPNLKDFKEEI